ncbi:hypothetical protein C5167_030205 [Papaver somniferum]|nr:hypothetical protein C5167_030205 [Papaver somniferum]
MFLRTSSTHQRWSNCASHKDSLKMATSTQFQECAKLCSFNSKLIQLYAIYSNVSVQSVCLPRAMALCFVKILLVLVIRSSRFRQALVSLWQKHVVLLGTTFNICRRGATFSLWPMEFGDRMSRKPCPFITVLLQANRLS